jgi:hypothetical protein
MSLPDSSFQSLSNYLLRSKRPVKTCKVGRICVVAYKSLLPVGASVITSGNTNNTCTIAIIRNVKTAKVITPTDILLGLQSFTPYLLVNKRVSGYIIRSSIYLCIPSAPKWLFNPAR